MRAEMDGPRAGGLTVHAAPEFCRARPQLFTAPPAIYTLPHELTVGARGPVRVGRHSFPLVPVRRQGRAGRPFPLILLQTPPEIASAWAPRRAPVKHEGPANPVAPARPGTGRARVGSHCVLSLAAPSPSRLALPLGAPRPDAAAHRERRHARRQKQSSGPRRPTRTAGCREPGSPT